MNSSWVYVFAVGETSLSVGSDTSWKVTKLNTCVTGS